MSLFAHRLVSASHGAFILPPKKRYASSDVAAAQHASPRKKLRCEERIVSQRQQESRKRARLSHEDAAVARCASPHKKARVEHDKTRANEACKRARSDDESARESPEALRKRSRGSPSSVGVSTPEQLEGAPLEAAADDNAPRAYDSGSDEIAAIWRSVRTAKRERSRSEGLVELSAKLGFGCKALKQFDVTEALKSNFADDDDGPPDDLVGATLVSGEWMRTSSTPAHTTTKRSLPTPKKTAMKKQPPRKKREKKPAVKKQPRPPPPKKKPTQKPKMEAPTASSQPSRFRIEAMRADGNCAFHALAYYAQTDDEDTTHASIRERIVERMRSKMVEDASWADGLEMELLTLKLDNRHCRGYTVATWLDALATPCTTEANGKNRAKWACHSTLQCAADIFGVTIRVHVFHDDFTWKRGLMPFPITTASKYSVQSIEPLAGHDADRTVWDLALKGAHYDALIVV